MPKVWTTDKLAVIINATLDRIRELSAEAEGGYIYPGRSFATFIQEAADAKGVPHSQTARDQVSRIIFNKGWLATQYQPGTFKRGSLRYYAVHPDAPKKVTAAILDGVLGDYTPMLQRFEQYLAVFKEATVLVLPNGTSLRQLALQCFPGENEAVIDELVAAYKKGNHSKRPPSPRT